jgi:ribosomal protein S18 acetylase RimI-like enzyme
MEVRRLRVGEHDAASVLVVAAYRALPGAHMSGGYELDLADVARRDAEADVLVAVDGRDLIGCVTFVPDSANPWAEELEDGEASIRMLAVDPAAQGRGVGRALLDACEQRAHSLGRRAIFLHSTPWMAAAHRLYARIGFVRVPERDWLPVPEVPLLAFRLDLRRGDATD